MFGKLPPIYTMILNMASKWLIALFGLRWWLLLLWSLLMTIGALRMNLVGVVSLLTGLIVINYGLRQPGYLIFVLIICRSDHMLSTTRIDTYVRPATETWLT